MTHGRETEECGVCGRPAEDGYCSPGCRDIAREFESEERVREPRDDGDGDAEVTFLRVDGMHSVAGERFLERRAEATDGVSDAEASYVTETVRVIHDPGLDADVLRDSLSALGYTAYLRDEAETADGSTLRESEVAGMRAERDEHMLEARYVVGVVFGLFVLIPYVAIVYPGYLAEFSDAGPLHYFDVFSLEGAGGFVFLRVYLFLTGVVLYFTAIPILQGAYASLRIGRPNTDLVVALTALSAYVYGTVAALTGGNEIYYDLTIVVSSVVMTAAFYEEAVKKEALGALTDLTSSQVDEARLYEGGGALEEVPVSEVDEGDKVLVREGERVPVDGTLSEGGCTVDESVVTGESLPVAKDEGDDVVGGSVVVGGAAVVRAGDASGGIGRLTDAVWGIQSADHATRRRVDGMASVAFPVVAVVGVGAGVARLATGAGALDAVLSALTVFLVGSPWALGFAAPVSVASSIREAARNSIVVFDETVFERLRGVEAVVFDKTGTLTRGEMEVVDATGDEDALASAAALERLASHPAAEAVADGFPANDGRVEGFETLATGVRGDVDGETVLVGSSALFEDERWSVPARLSERASEAERAGRLPVVAGRGGEAEAVVVLRDEPKGGWEETVEGLSDRGVDVVVLTGDDEEAAERFGNHPDVDRTFAEVPPEGKREAVRRMSSRADGDVAMVGDGTNDALALAEADFGISMGDGTALASDAAGLAIADDDIRLVERAFDVSEAAGRRFATNARLSLVYTAVAVPLAVAGLLNPFFATGAAVLTVAVVLANSRRSLV